MIVVGFAKDFKEPAPTSADLMVPASFDAEATREYGVRARL